MADSVEIKTMRYMEWERTKGSLGAILASYWDCDAEAWDDLRNTVEKFVKEFGEKAALD